MCKATSRGRAGSHRSPPNRTIRSPIDPGTIHDPNEQLQQADHKLIKHILSKVQCILARAVDRPWTADIERELGIVFSSCLEFHRVLLRQPAQFGVEMIFTRAHDGQERLFDPNLMTDVSNEKEETLEDRGIEMSLFPLVYKRGDERGDNLNIKIIVSKAKVLL